MDVDKNSSILSNKSFFQTNEENMYDNECKMNDKKNEKNSSVSNDFKL